MSTAQSHPDIDVAMQMSLRARTDHELARRSIPGAPAYVVILGMLALVSDELRVHALAFGVAGAIFVVVGSLRSVCAVRMLRETSPSSSRYVLRGATMVLGTAWGLFVAHILHVHPDLPAEAWTPLVCLLLNGALASGVAASFAPAPWTARVSVVAMQVPPIIATAFNGIWLSWALSGVISIFLLYLFLQIRDQHLSYSTALRDNGELELRTRALEEANQLARSAIAARETFLANMSHELRTPLNGIIGLTALSLDSDLDPETQTYLEHVKYSAEGMVTMVNSVLDFGKAQRGELTLHQHAFLLRDVLTQVGRSYGTLAHRKDVELVLDIDPALPGRFWGDSRRIGQVLEILVSNAIKFTPSGQVVVRIDGTPTPQDPAVFTLRMSVADSGIGIPEARRSEIFEAFTQLDDSLTREQQGSGIGLALCTSLVRQMGGTLTVTSSVSRGSTFVAEVDLPSSRDARDTENQRLRFDGPIWIVDSCVRAREVFEREFSRHGGPVRVFASASEVRASWRTERARDTAAESAPSARPVPFVVITGPLHDATVVECLVTLLHDGLPAARLLPTLRSTDLRNALPPLRERGIEAFIVRPCLPEAVCESVANAMAAMPPGPAKPVLAATAGLPATTGPSPPQEPGVALPGPAGPRRAAGLHILLAEDNPVNQKVAARLLEREGHDVRVVEHGQAAVDVLEHEAYDLVLTDLQMPVMDGIDLARWVRSQDQQSGGHTPLVVVTAHAMASDRTRCLDAGVDGFVTKPIQIQELRDAIASAIGTTRPRAA